MNQGNLISSVVTLCCWKCQIFKSIKQKNLSHANKKVQPRFKNFVPNTEPSFCLCCGYGSSAALQGGRPEALPILNWFQHWWGARVRLHGVKGSRSQERPAARECALLAVMWAGRLASPLNQKRKRKVMEICLWWLSIWMSGQKRWSRQRLSF